MEENTLLHHLLPAWRGRRALLVCDQDPVSRAMHVLLDEIGARPACVSPACDSETLCRALLSGRGTIMIVPSLNAYLALPPERQLPALRSLLGEAREAGTPLVTLLADQSAAPALAPLMCCADEFCQGAHGDAVSIQAIWHDGMNVQKACIGVLALGARFLSGDLSCTGIIAL